MTLRTFDYFCSSGSNFVTLNSSILLTVVTVYGKYTAKAGQDNMNMGVVTTFRLANTSLLQVY